MQQDVPGARIDAVLPDNRAAARAMTEHLLGLGHKRIGFLHGGMPEWNVPMRERFEGYRDALVGVNTPFDESLVLQAGTFESVLTDGQGHVHAESIAAYLNKPNRPTALFVPVDMLAIKVMEVARDEMGLRVPEDVAIAGFDDIGAAAHTSPPLTTVRHPTAEIGRRAAELLFERANEKSSRARSRVHHRIPCELVIRRSCGGSPHSTK
jgi:LacI family repressor for deo operon, udp, cdd, tsx, nupC, and nupG